MVSPDRTPTPDRVMILTELGPVLCTLERPRSVLAASDPAGLTPRSRVFHLLQAQEDICINFKKRPAQGVLQARLFRRAGDIPPCCCSVTSLREN